MLVEKPVDNVEKCGHIITKSFLSTVGAGVKNMQMRLHKGQKIMGQNGLCCRFTDWGFTPIFSEKVDKSANRGERTQVRTRS